jgi:AraC-like DNA-binding protein
MILESKIIEFKGMPLFQKARFKTPFEMQGAIRDFACFFYIVEGNMLSYDSRGIHAVGEKEAILKNCNNYVQRYVPNKHQEECEAIAIYLYPDLLKTIYQNEVPSFLKIDEAPKPEKLIGNKLIDQYMTNLSIYFEAPEALDEELGILKLKELMMILLKSQRHESIRKMLSEIFTPVNLEFKNAIEKNLFNPLGVDQLAFICNMSLSTFKREFKRAFQDTPARYIKHKRLEHAASLLICSDEPVSAIAYESGFQDASTFSSSFQEKYSVSPSAYRRTKSETI